MFEQLIFLCKTPLLYQRIYKLYLSKWESFYFHKIVKIKNVKFLHNICLIMGKPIGYFKINVTPQKIAGYNKHLLFQAHWKMEASLTAQGIEENHLNFRLELVR
jgi:hypothetical protein